MKQNLILLVLALSASMARAGGTPAVKHVLFFSKASSWEHNIVHRNGNQLSFLEKELQKLGREGGIEVTCTKDGRYFTPENIARYDAFLFYTSGDLTSEKRVGRGDNYPLMTLAGKKAFLDAIENGKGFIGCNTAMYTFTDPVSPGEPKNDLTIHRYTKMIGAAFIGHNELQDGHLIQVDRTFPGMESVPVDYRPYDQWYGFHDLMPDLHVIVALDASQMVGNLYGRPNYPLIWARMEGKGRVYYTTIGHVPAIWLDPVFRHMLLGGIRWACGLVNADVTPNIATVTPQANDIPVGARKFVPSNPPQDDPHFPNFKIWYTSPPEVPGEEH